jgi:hypothetical protein
LTPPFLPMKCARCSLSKRWGAVGNCFSLRWKSVV